MQALKVALDSYHTSQFTTILTDLNSQVTDVKETFEKIIQLIGKHMDLQ